MDSGLSRQHQACTPWLGLSELQWDSEILIPFAQIPIFFPDGFVAIAVPLCPATPSTPPDLEQCTQPQAAARPVDSWASMAVSSQPAHFDATAPLDAAALREVAPVPTTDGVEVSLSLFDPGRLPVSMNPVFAQPSPINGERTPVLGSRAGRTDSDTNLFARGLRAPIASLQLPGADRRCPPRYSLVEPEDVPITPT
jgi:hypothetical protein